MKPRDRFPRRLRLETVARRVVEQVLRRLPDDLRSSAAKCAVILEWGADSETDSELLGYFVGSSCLEGESASAADLPRIVLLLDHLWDYAEQQMAVFEQEVAVTLLHELGHYFGWEEDEIEARGLG